MIRLLTIFLMYAAFISISCSSSDDSVIQTPPPNASSQPNIMLIIADDIGQDAAPGYDIAPSLMKPAMPNIQNMINKGITFTNVWAYPTCSPTRASIITGKYGIRTGVTEVGIELLSSETSLQKYISDNTNDAYSNAVIGKWHLSSTASHPNSLGVDHFEGFLGGGVSDYFSWIKTKNGVTDTDDTTTYTTTEFTNSARDWIQEQTKPWFLWLAYNAPHTPFQKPPVDLHPRGDGISSDMDFYLASIEALDTEFGRLLNSMPTKTRENTIFIFIGDNGTPGRVRQAYAMGRTKGSLYQGGINVPMYISGNGVTRTGATEDALINSTDLFATIAELAGVSVPEINDSVSFKSLLSNENASVREFVYGERSTSDTAIRNTTHKYVNFNGVEEFYNLENDAFEEDNLIEAGKPSLNTKENAILTQLKNKLADIQN